MRLESVVDLDRFRRLRPEWNELLAASDADTIFLTWEWLFTWWTLLAGRRRLAILALWSGRDLMAVLPLALRPPQPGRLAFTWRREFLGSGSVGSDYLDLIVRRGEEVRAIDTLVEALGRGRVTLDLGPVRATGAQVTHLAEALQAHGWTVAPRVAPASPFIPLRGESWETFVESLGPAHRANLRRRLRGLSRTGEMRFEEATDDAARRLFLKHLIDLHLKRRGTLDGSEAFDHPDLVAFHERFSALALERGWLRLFLLTLDRRPVAAFYGFRYRDVFSFYQSGFDPDYGRLSVGLVAMGLTIRQALEEAAVEFDFLHGEESYKSLWTSHRRELQRLELSPPIPAGALARRLDEAGRGARRLARALLPHGLAARLARGFAVASERRSDDS
jgi:CelD/BcsL family acetyltransferase involved in cellulose biosynthesis